MNLEQDFSNFLPGESEQILALEDTTVGSLDHNRNISSNLIFTQTNTFAGHLVSGIISETVIFDSTTLSGMVLYVPLNGHVDLAQANNLTTTVAVGLAKEDIIAAQEGDYITEGQIQRNNWTNVAGTEFLTPGAIYYLSTSNPGQITIIAPTTISQFVVAIGKALTIKIFDIEIAQSILL